MAGLTAAAELQRAGRRVLVLDKGRGVGGRMATRRLGAATFDHGAQFMTARDPRFARAVEDWRQLGVVDEWCRGFSGRGDGHVRWRGQPGMTAVPKQLARDLPMALETEVIALRHAENRWCAESARGESFVADAVILTPPVPQTLSLLDRGEIALAAEMRARLTRIEYERCLAVMAVLDGPSRLLAPGALAPDEGPIAWMSDNHVKGISAVPAVTIHATHEFSVKHWDDDRRESGQRLLDAAKDSLGANVIDFEVRAWRFSKPMEVDPQRCAIVCASPPLILAGDAFAGPRVEGAALSGWAAAEALLRSTSPV